MASPALAGTVASGNTQTAATALVLTYPTSVTAGELLIACIAHKDTAGSRTWPAGWTEFKTVSQATGSVAVLSWAWKAAAGTETGNFTVTDTVSTRWAWFVARISGADTSAAPAASTGVATANTTAPNPDSLTPAGGSKDYLWVASFASSHGRIASAYPTNYGLFNTTAGPNNGTATNIGVGVAGRALTGTVDDPGAFTTTGTAVEETAALTIAIAPSAAGTVTGVVLTITPSLPTGLLNHTITGTVLTVTPTLPTGSVTIPGPQTVTGVVLTITPSLPIGTLNHSITGVVLTATPSLPTGALKVSLTGVVITATPSLPTGAVNRSLTGVVLTATPSLPTGSLKHSITGLVLTATPSLPTGAVNVSGGAQTVTGVVLTVTPTLPVGVVGVSSLIGVTLTVTPTLPRGLVRDILTRGNWKVTEFGEPHAVHVSDWHLLEGAGVTNTHHVSGTHAGDQHRTDDTHDGDWHVDEGTGRSDHH